MDTHEQFKPRKDDKPTQHSPIIPVHSNNWGMCLIIFSLIIMGGSVLLVFILKHDLTQLADYKFDFALFFAGIGLPSIVKRTLDYLNKILRN